MAALSPGTRLGAYEILEPIGKGGMGEVYRARDTTLGRDVAIKVLPEDFASDEERLARFRREAQVLASLNHPNIAAIYGTEQNALVLELVKGPTLAERIAQGAIPLDEAIAIARQIAEALEAAHEAGVIHRDLKPANIKVQEDGTVKVLDFGLAKAVEGEAEGDASESPTMTAAATRAGVIMGTAAYMSPEQAKGKRVDRRADIWAFGVVLYEMLTGRRPFAGEDVSETLAHVLTKEPDWERLPANLSPALRNYLVRCFEKDPKRRVRDIGDVRLALEGAFETGATASERRVGWPAIGAALVLGGILAGFTVRSSRPDLPRPLVRSIVSPPSLPPNLGPPDVDVAITPAGTHIVYVSLTDRRQLAVRALDELEATPLAGLGDVRGPFLSPDGKWIGFFGASELQRVSILGGPPITICELNGGARGASWGADDTIVFATNGSGGLWRVAAGGGEAEQLTTPELEQRGHRWPEILPDGEHVLFTIESGARGNDQIALLSLATREWKVLVAGGSNPRYAPSGHIVYGVGGTLRAVGFDLDRLELTSDPIPVLDGVVTKDTGAADFGVSRDGSLTYVAGPPVSRVERTLVWVDREGKEEAIAAEPRGYVYPRISPDGTRLALDVRDQATGIWVWDFARETLTRLTFDRSLNYHPTWTPDGRRVAFSSNRNGAGARDLFWKAADGTGTIEQLSESDSAQVPSTFTPDGTALVFWERSPETKFDLLVRSMDETGSTERLLATEFQEGYADISPDGRWLAYRSNASGQNEIWVRPFPNVDDGQWPVSRGGGHRPRWSPAGGELFYLSPNGQLMSVRYETDPSFTPSNPELVLEEPFVTSGPFGPIYDVSRDGRRFLKIQEGTSGNEADPARVILVQNWTEELKRLVPVDP